MVSISFFIRFLSKEVVIGATSFYQTQCIYIYINPRVLYRIPTVDGKKFASDFT